MKLSAALSVNEGLPELSLVDDTPLNKPQPDALWSLAKQPFERAFLQRVGDAVQKASNKWELQTILSANFEELLGLDLDLCAFGL